MTFSEAKKFLDPENIIKIGQILKPHGYKGHITANFKFDPLKLKEESVLVRINGWLIPFSIDYDNSNLSALKPIIKFRQVNSEQEAQKLAHKTIYLPKYIAKKYIDLRRIDNLIGFQLIDQTSNKSGIIIDSQDIPKNPLIVVQTPEQQALIPVNAVEIIKLDEKNKKVYVKLPHGLI